MSVTVLVGDVRDRLRDMPDESVHCVVTSPPYFGLRDYGVAGQIGLEPTLAAFVAALVDVFREVRRVLRSDGTCWVNLGDSYASGGWSSRDDDKKLPQRGMGMRPKDGLKPKDLIGIPWRVAFALQADGWWLRQDIIWHKPNPMPESVTDRCTKAHEYLFLLTQSERYFFDAGAVRQDASPNTHARGKNGSREQPRSVGLPRYHRGGRRDSGVMRDDGVSRNRRSVWTIATQPFAGAHFATFPPALVEPCILAGCPTGGTVLDPFLGAGTTGLVADRLGRNCIGIELNPGYAEIARKRIGGDASLLSRVTVIP